MATINSTAPGEVIVGTDGVDELTANHNNVTLIGGLGDDMLISSVSSDGTTMDGGAGMDFMIGDGTNDTASYASAPAGVEVDLSAFTTNNDGYGGNDILLGIENVTGSAFADSLTGDDLANVLAGGAGNDTLTGGAGDDIFNYSFNLAQTSGGGSTTTFNFTDWLSAKYGKDFGAHLPDYVPGPDKHGKDDKKDSKDDKGGKDSKGGKDDKKDSKDDKSGKDSKDSKDSKDDSHHHNDGPSADTGLTQDFFSKNYTEWLKDVVVADLLARGLVQDVNGNGKIDIGLNQNDPLGTPFIEGLSAEQLAAMFSDRDGVVLKTGHHAQERFYSNDYTSTSGGVTTAAVTSGDGFDTIVDFGNGADKLQFDFSADTNWAAGQANPLAYLESFFNIGHTDYTNDGFTDTRLSVDMNNDGNAEWSVVLAGNDLTDAQVFAALDISVNGTLIG